MHPRKRLLLRLAHLAGGKISRLRLMKLTFLIAQNPDMPAALKYGFVPYHHGPFSFALYRDWRTLATTGFTFGDGEDGGPFRITEAGQKLASQEPTGSAELIDVVHEQWTNTTTDALIDDIYGRHPWFSHRSERDGGRHKRATPSAEPAVYTVGYQGLSIDAFLNLLLERGITQLVDTRFTPASRVYEYHASTLRNLCERVGIGFQPEPMLGVPKNTRERFFQARNHRQFKRDYSEILRAQRDRVIAISDLMTRTPAAVMCYERDVSNCHRSYLAHELAAISGLDKVDLRE